jgi:hypothetical protein
MDIYYLCARYAPRATCLDDSVTIRDIINAQVFWDMAVLERRRKPHSVFQVSYSYTRTPVRPRLSVACLNFSSFGLVLCLCREEAPPEVLEEDKTL